MKYLSLLLWVFSLATGHGTTIMAASGNLSDVQAAVNKAYPGDTVTIHSGTYTWSGTLGITKSLVLQGAGSKPTFIRGRSFFNDYNGLISISPPVNVSLVRITGIKFNNLNIGMNYNSLATISIWGSKPGEPLPLAFHTRPIGLSVKAQKKWLEWFFNSATQQG